MIIAQTKTKRERVELLRRFLKEKGLRLSGNIIYYVKLGWFKNLAKIYVYDERDIVDLSDYNGLIIVEVKRRYARVIREIFQDFEDEFKFEVNLEIMG